MTTRIPRSERTREALSELGRTIASRMYHPVGCSTDNKPRNIIIRTSQSSLNRPPHCLKYSDDGHMASVRFGIPVESRIPNLASVRRMADAIARPSGCLQFLTGWGYHSPRSSPDRVF